MQPHHQFRLRAVFSTVFWISVLLAAVVQSPWPLVPAIILIWLAGFILYQAVVKRMDSERATISFFAALGSAVPFGVFGLAAVGITDPHPVKPIAFEATAWQRADPIEDYRTVRSQMIDDLLQRHNFRGWTEDEVIEVLGPPDGKPPAMRSVHMLYRLGRERGVWALDDEYLYFQFDVQNRVTKFGLTVD
ncbi:MAG TPA: hypothetical protein VF306_11235 [Pirellulales bacterium]